MVRFIKPVLFAACLLPLALLIWNGLHDRLTANPIAEITHQTGDWTLRFILLTLSITPLRRLTGWSEIIRVRRMLGLFAFLYGTLHFSTYLVLDQFFAFDEIVKDIRKRPFITVGFTSFVLLIPLALTSSAAMIRRLGGRRWQQLHRLIYLTAIGGVVHYWWLVKADVRRPQAYAAVVLLLLGYRVVTRLTRRGLRAERHRLVRPREQVRLKPDTP